MFGLGLELELIQRYQHLRLRRQSGKLQTARKATFYSFPVWYFLFACFYRRVSQPFLPCYYRLVNSVPISKPIHLSTNQVVLTSGPRDNSPAVILYQYQVLHIRSAVHNRDTVFLFCFQMYSYGPTSICMCSVVITRTRSMSLTSIGS